jgi:hypothetical protein
MKTLKLTLVAALVAMMMIPVVNADGIKEKPRFNKSVNLSIENALKNPGLTAAMYSQVSPDILKYPMPPITAVVKYSGAQYRISGTVAEWKQFFRTKGIFPCEGKEKKPSID